MSGVVDVVEAVDAGAVHRRDAPTFTRACTIGAAISTAVYAWMLAIGRLDFFQRHVLDNLYDAQAHNLLGGHWDIPRKELGFEAWVIDGKSYTYFGPWPAILRLPVAAVTDRLDGRLTQLSMLLAFVVLMVATVRFLTRLRELMRADRPVTRLESWSGGGFVVVTGVGSATLFLASRPVIYHEVQLWAIALAVASFAALFEFLLRPRPRALAWAGLFAALSLLTRGSVGIGPIAALGLVLLGVILAELARRLDRPALRRPLPWFGLREDATDRRFFWPLVLVIAIPVAAYMYVNWVKFGHPWSLPISQHATSFTDELRRRVYEENGGSLFGLKFVPTDMIAMFRPDALGLDALFPWVTFPSAVSATSGITFIAIDPTTSIPASMPFFFLLSVVGAVVVFRPQRRVPSPAAAMRVLVIGAGVCAIGVISLPYVYQRYMADFIPLLVLLSAAGLFGVLGWFENVQPRRPGLGRAIVGALLALALASLWINFALTILYQRAYGPYAPDSERAAFVRFQHDVDDLVSDGSHMNVRRGDTLPDPLPAGTVFVIGDCDGAYWSDGTGWHAIERTSATGGFPLVVTFGDRTPGTREVLLTAGQPGNRDSIAVEYLPNDRIRFVYRNARLDRQYVTESQARPDEPTRVDLLYDDRLGHVGIDVDGGIDWGLIVPLSPDPPRVSAGVEVGSTTKDFCRDLLATD